MMQDTEYEIKKEECESDDAHIKKQVIVLENRKWKKY